MPKKKSAGDIVKEIQYAMVMAIQKKVMERLAGDATAAPSDTEMGFLQNVLKYEQEQDQNEALVSYLAEMDDDALDKYHEKLRQSLEEGDRLN